MHRTVIIKHCFLYIAFFKILKPDQTVLKRKIWHTKRSLSSKTWQFTTVKYGLQQVSKYKHNIFYLLLRITPTHSNYIKIWATQSFVTFKTQWKNETYENFIYSFKKCFTWNAIQNSFIHTKKNIFLWKSVSLFWIDFTSALSILLKSKVANNLITIMGYSNDKNIYIVKNIISID